MKAAKNSEIESIGVSWGYHRPEVLKTETNNIAQNFDDILNILYSRKNIYRYFV